MDVNIKGLIILIKKFDYSHPQYQLYIPGTKSHFMNVQNKKMTHYFENFFALASIALQVINYTVLLKTHTLPLDNINFGRFSLLSTHQEISLP